MTPAEIREAISADPVMVQAVHDALAETVDATPHWQALADQVCAGRTRLRAERRMTELDVRAALPITQAVPLLRTLRQLHDAADAPAWLTQALTSMGKPDDEHILYLDTLQCGWRWLQSTRGLDVADATTRGMLNLLKAVHPDMADACVALLDMGREPDTITELDVRRAVLADDGSVRV